MKHFLLSIYEDQFGLENTPCKVIPARSRKKALEILEAAPAEPGAKTYITMSYRSAKKHQIRRSKSGLYSLQEIKFVNP